MISVARWRAPGTSRSSADKSKKYSDDAHAIPSGLAMKRERTRQTVRSVGEVQEHRHAPVANRNVAVGLDRP